ncbi:MULTISPECIES: cation-translocating P-type ATPase [unclassified Nocardioides]|uniref:heavy metal translocating P-type ATPase n=1 Tax=unclassified Nocardioides TaxID=2615069 RepID=UPI002405EC87|nr:MULTISPECIES: cation-translocating P-type ATPase [unclassified Nocardioides]
MSDFCCGPDDEAPEDNKTEGAPHGHNLLPLLTLSPGATERSGASDGAPDSSLATAPAGHTFDDDCCGPSRRAADAPLKLERFAPWWRDRALLLPAISGLLLALGLLADHVVDAGSFALALHATALGVGGWTFVPGALRRLRRGRLGVGLLMTIAALGAVALGKVGEAAALAFLFSIAEALEERSMDRAQHGLRALLTLIPDTARVRRADAEIDVPAAELRIGDLLVVRAGDRISTDGVVVEGRSSLDTAAITGESIPVQVGPGQTSLAGSVNGQGTLLVRAAADGRDNSLTQIVRLVEEAHARKGDRARLADRIARPLVPSILLLSTLVALGGLLLTDEPLVWVERALVVLVAASPCAMAIAVPVTVISAIGSASRLGVIIKSGHAFEQLGTIRTVAFDKTGTLTRNRPEVVDVRTTADYKEVDVLRWAAALEATSSHPLAEAVVAATKERARASEVSEIPGRGVTDFVDGHRVRIGSPRWVEPGPLMVVTDELAAGGMSVVVVEVDGAVAGAIGVRDELKPEAAEAVSMLHERGISTIMLTGDNHRTAQTLAQQVGILDVRSEQLPADKVAAIEASARLGPTAMIGDGINDAPALASASVGIAMGWRGRRQRSSPPTWPSPAPTFARFPAPWTTPGAADGS